MNDYDPYEPQDPGHDDQHSPEPDQAPEPEYELQYEVDPVPRPTAPPSYVSVPCTRCGYNLTGIAIGGNCPECGAMVDASLYASGGGAPPNGMAITSMIIGIIAVAGLCCCPTGYLGIIGLIFGLVANNQMSTGAYNNASKGMATAGLICSGIGIGLALVWTLLAILG